MSRPLKAPRTMPRELPSGRGGQMAARLVRAQTDGPVGAAASLAREISADHELAAQVLLALAKGAARP